MKEHNIDHHFRDTGMVALVFPDSETFRGLHVDTVWLGSASLIAT